MARALIFPWRGPKRRFLCFLLLVLPAVSLLLLSYSAAFAAPQIRGEIANDAPTDQGGLDEELLMQEVPTPGETAPARETPRETFPEKREAAREWRVRSAEEDEEDDTAGVEEAWDGSDGSEGVPTDFLW